MIPRLGPRRLQEPGGHAEGPKVSIPEVGSTDGVTVEILNPNRLDGVGGLEAETPGAEVESGLDCASEAPGLPEAVLLLREGAVGGGASGATSDRGT